MDVDNMYGAIYGDLVGSLYEYSEFKKHDKELMLKASNEDKLIKDESFISDDSILTIAILDAYLNGYCYEKKLREYILNNSEKLNKENYFKYLFSPNIIKWARDENVVGNSIGNGALMRVSPISNLCDSLFMIYDQTIRSTSVTHKSNQALKGSLCVSTMIYLARSKYSLDSIKKVIDMEFPYKYDFDLEDLRNGMKFNTTCDETMPLVLYSIFNTNNFDDAIRLTLSLGGDTDTNCCIVGSIAEALYGMKDEDKEIVNKYLPNEYVKKLTLK